MFNTLNYARKLEEAGVAREQAEAHVQIIAEIVEGDLATKQDVSELKTELSIVNNDLKAVSNDLKIQMGHQGTFLKSEIEKAEYRLVIKLGILVFGVISTVVSVALGIAAILFR